MLVLDWKKKNQWNSNLARLHAIKKALLSEVVFICTGSGGFPGTRGNPDTSSQVGRLTAKVITAPPPRHQGTSGVEQPNKQQKLNFQPSSTNINLKVFRKIYTRSQTVDGCLRLLQSSSVVFSDASGWTLRFSDRWNLLRRLLVKCPDRFFRVVSDDWSHIDVDQLCSLTFWKICGRDFLAAS